MMGNYFYDKATRQLFPMELKARYLETGTWPKEGFEVPDSVADQYIQDPRRDAKKIVQAGDDEFAIKDA